MATILFCVLTFGLSLLYAKLSRMAGGGPPKLPLGLDAHIWAAPWGVAGAFLGKHLLTLAFTIPFTGIAVSSATAGFLIAYFFAFLGKRLGHGQYYDLSAEEHDTQTDAEKIDFIVSWIFGPDGFVGDPNGERNFWRDFFGLSLTGFFVSIGLAVLALFAGHFLWAFILMATSVAKGLAYWLPLKYPDQVRGLIMKFGVVYDSPYHTESGEYLTGFFSGLGIFGYLLYLIMFL